MTTCLTTKTAGPILQRRISQGLKTQAPSTSLRAGRRKSGTLENAYRALRMKEPARRFYSANLARWLSRDPFGDPAGEDIYVYVLNDPVCMVDPDGLTALFVCYDDKGKEITVNKADDIYVKTIIGQSGDFQESLVFRYDPSDPDKPGEMPVCKDFHYILSIEAGGATVVSGATYFYVPHVKGNDGAATGQYPLKAQIAHEKGHARAYFEVVKTCAENVHTKWSGKILSAADRATIDTEYEACKTDAYNLKSAEYANSGTRQYMDTSGLFVRTFPTDPKDIGIVTETISAAGHLWRSTDRWVAK